MRAIKTAKTGHNDCIPLLTLSVIAVTISLDTLIIFLFYYYLDARPVWRKREIRYLATTKAKIIPTTTSSTGPRLAKVVCVAVATFATKSLAEYPLENISIKIIGC